VISNQEHLKEFIKDNWENIKDTVRNEYDISDVSYTTWINPLVFHDINDENNILTILIPSDQNHFQKYITSKYTLYFQVTIAELTDITYDILFILKNEKENRKVKSIGDGIYYNVNYENAGLNSKYLFDSFVVGGNNSFAHSAALAVAEAPGVIYNPLYIYSGPGLGKTHLIQAIGHFILNNNPNAKVLYVTSEEFVNEVTASIRFGKGAEMSELREKYRSVDVFLLDDVQFIIGKDATQNEFFHTFNALHLAGKQIVLTSDKPPKDFDILEERIRSRFAWGLIADMQVPDYENRVAILQRKAETENIKIDDFIIEYIAKNITSNIRELEGALSKVLAFIKMEKNDLSMHDIEKKLKDIIYNEKQEITPKLIINIVADNYNVDYSDIISKKRNAEFVYPRQVVMYLCRQLIGLPYNQIGKILGGKDHSTVMHGEQKIADDLLSNEELRNKIEIIKKIISPS
jgi:chromosomal replication initiator protein